MAGDKPETHCAGLDPNCEAVLVLLLVFSFTSILHRPAIRVEHQA